MKSGLKDILFTILKLIILLVSIFIISVLMKVIGAFITNGMTDERIIFTITKTLDTVGILLAVFLFFRINKEFNLMKKLKEQLKINKNLFRVFVIVAIASAVIMPIILYLLGYMKFNWFVWNKLFAEDIFAIMILGLIECFFETFCEEIIYRFAIYEITMKSLNKIWAYILSTMIYVLIYAFDKNISIMAIINIALLNILMMSLYIKYKNIWLCIIPRSIFEYIISFGFSINRYGNNVVGIIGYKYCGNTFVSGGVYGINGSVFITALFVALIFFTTKKEFAKR